MRNFRKIYGIIIELSCNKKKKKKKKNRIANFLDLNIKVQDSRFQTKLYDKRDNFMFNIIRLP